MKPSPNILAFRVVITVLTFAILVLMVATVFGVGFGQWVVTTGPTP